jgi:hypothetical protein
MHPSTVPARVWVIPPGAGLPASSSGDQGLWLAIVDPIGWRAQLGNLTSPQANMAHGLISSSLPGEKSITRNQLKGGVPRLVPCVCVFVCVYDELSCVLRYYWPQVSWQKGDTKQNNGLQHGTAYYTS